VIVVKNVFMGDCPEVVMEIIQGMMSWTYLTEVERLILN
jgi:hypothetical protein